VFTGRAVSGPPRAASFRPHIGCIPASGGGSRIPTVAHVVPPGHPSARHVWEVKVRPGVQTLRKSCGGGATLVSATHAVGFDTKNPPSAALIASVHATHTVRNGRVSVSIRAGSKVRNRHAEVQIILTCAGGT
jgi:hypothetical protein